LICVGSVHAQQEPVTISVYPPVFELQLKKGQNYQSQILLRNKSNLPIPIDTTITNFTASDEMGGIRFKEGKISQWFKIEKSDFILKPKGSERIKFEIEVPKDIARGGYYGVILFKSKLPSYYFEKEATKAIPQIGVLFLISVGKREKANFEIVEFGISEKSRIKPLEKITKTVLVNGSYIPFILRVKNNDIYHIKPSGLLKIYKTTENGSPQNIIGETEIKETTILPGKIRQFSVNFKPNLSQRLYKYLPDFLADFLSENLFLGKYKVVLELHGSGAIEKEMSILIFPLKGAIILILLVVLSLFIIIKYKKRREREHQTTRNRTRKDAKVS